MTKQDLQQFYKDHPQLTAHGSSVELKNMGISISARNLANIISGDQKLTKKMSDKILPLLIKYGYDSSLLKKALVQNEVTGKTFNKKNC